MNNDLFRIKNEQGSSRVLFSCNRNDFEEYFESLTDELLETRDCAIYYFKNLDYFPDDLEDYLVVLNQFDLIIMPITLNFIAEESRARDIDLRYAKENKIPLLPILVQPGLYDLFNQLASIQVLDKTAEDSTQESYKEKLKKYVDYVLVDSETSERIKDAFDAYIFLSYRKRDRKYAQEVMRLIHQNDYMRDVAIWYDEFLTPGEDFNDEIFSNLLKSKVMAMVVTPNINERYGEKGNYVIEEEYPRALKENKKVIPIETITTDKKELKSNFAGIADPIRKENSKAIEEAFREFFFKEGIKENNSPEHLFFIGLAYLLGIEVEKDINKGLEILDVACDKGGIQAAVYLSKFYTTNAYYMDPDRAIKYMELAIDRAKTNYESQKTDKNWENYSLCVNQISELLNDNRPFERETNKEHNNKIISINREYWKEFRKKETEKRRLIEFLYHCYLTENRQSTNLLDEIASIDSDFLSSKSPEYFSILRDLAKDHDADLFFNISAEGFEDLIDYKNTWSWVLIEKSKLISDKTYFETMVAVWSFFDTWLELFDTEEEDPRDEIEQRCEPIMLQMLKKDWEYLIQRICYHGWAMDDVFCYGCMEQISLIIQNNINGYITDNPVYVGALIQFFDLRGERKIANEVFYRFIEYLEKQEIIEAAALMKIAMKWDADIPFYKELLHYVKLHYKEDSNVDKDVFRGFATKLYSSREVEKEQCFLNEVNEFVDEYLNYRYQDEEITKYDELFLIARMIPNLLNNRYARINVLDIVVSGYRKLIGEKGKTIIAEKMLAEIKR